MAPNWYYAAEENGREYFIAYVDAKGSCSKRRFDATSGVFVDQTAGTLGKSFAEYFSKELRAYKRIGELSGRPNLVDAVRAGRLPSDVMAELKRRKPRSV